MNWFSNLSSKNERLKTNLSVGFVPKVPVGVMVVVPGIQTTELHRLSKRRTPDVVVVDQRHGEMVVGWWCGCVCEDEEMVDGNDEADPCLICLGPRPYQVTCHQGRTNPYLSSLSSSSRSSREPRDIVTPSSCHWCSSLRHSFVISLLVTIMFLLSLRHPDHGSYTWNVVSSNIPRNEHALGRSFQTSEFLRPRRC